MMVRTLTLCALLAALGASPALAKRLPPGYGPTLPDVAAPPRPATGGIYNAANGYSPLVAGTRAYAVGDMLTITLVESTSTTKTAATKTSRTGSASITPPTAGPFAIDPNALNAASQSSFNGSGNTTQTNALNGTIAVTIAEARPNGTVLVRGEKRMMFSQGDEWIQFSGIVRVADIDQTNTISSTQVADAHIEYTGNGSIQRSAREGWLSHFFNILSPF